MSESIVPFVIGVVLLVIGIVASLIMAFVFRK